MKKLKLLEGCPYWLREAVENHESVFCHVWNENEDKRYRVRNYVDGYRAYDHGGNKTLKPFKVYRTSWQHAELIEEKQCEHDKNICDSCVDKNIAAHNEPCGSCYHAKATGKCRHQQKQPARETIPKDTICALFNTLKSEWFILSVIRLTKGQYWALLNGKFYEYIVPLSDCQPYLHLKPEAWPEALKEKWGLK